MKFLIILVVLVLLLGIYFVFNKLEAKTSGQTLSKEAFIEEVRKALQQQFPNEQYNYDAKEDSFILEEECKNKESDALTLLSLVNLYNHSKEMEPERRKEYIHNILTASTNNNLTKEQIEQNIRFRVRTAEELSLRSYYLPESEQSRKAAVKNIGNLILELVLDDPDSVRLLYQDDLKKQLVSLESAFILAENAVKETVVKDLWEPVGKHVWLSRLADDYDSARMVTLYPNLQLPFKGNPIAFFPSHASCLITDRNDEKTLQELMQTGEQLSADQRPLSYLLWEYKDNGWYPYYPDKDNSPGVYELLQTKYIQVSLNDYNEQKNALDQYLEKQGKDIFVASLSAYNHEKYGTFSLGVLTVGVQTYLPKSDRISLFQVTGNNEGDDYGPYAWDDVVKVLGKERFKQIENMLPVRYDFTDGITKAELQKVVKALD